MPSSYTSELLRVVTAISKDSHVVEQLHSEADKVLGVENNLIFRLIYSCDWKPADGAKSQ